MSPVKSETLHLNTFEYERYTKQQCDVVNLHLQGSLGEIEISALCFPKICLAVSAKVNVHIYAHLQGLELADASIVEGGGGTGHGFKVVRRTVPRSARKVSKIASKFLV